MDETEDFFVQVEKSLRIKIPHNVKLHLALSGFGNSVSLADITDKDIQDMELFAKTDLKEIVPNWNEYLGVFKEKIDSFRFFSGEKVLIYKMKEFAQKIRKDVEKDNNITSTSFSRAANARSINNDNKKKLDDRGDDSEQVQPRIQHDNLVEEVGMLRQVVKTGILNRIKSLKKEDHRICMEPFRDHEFIVKLDQLDNVYSNIKCPICEKEIKVQKFRNIHTCRWVTTNFTRHYVNHIPGLVSSSSSTGTEKESNKSTLFQKSIKTFITSESSRKTAEHAFNDVQSEKHSEKQNANIVIVTDVQVHPPTINKRNQDSLSSMDASTDTEQKKERLIQNDFRDEANSLLPHNALIGERDGERVGEQVGEPRTRLRRIFPRIAQTNFDDIITIPESEPLNKGPSKRRKIDESDELESEEKENQGENLENSSSDDSKPLQFFLKSRGCKETSSSAKQGKRSLEESIHLRKIDENRKWNRNKYTRASRNRRRRENISTKTKQYQLLITNYVEHLDQIEFVMKENDDLKKILFQEIPELNTTDTESNIPVFLKILNKAAQQNMKLTKNNKFSDDLLQFSVYLFIIGGRLLYESLYANLKKSLPSVSTVTRTIASTNNFEEGVLRFRELNEFLEKRKLPKIIWISEDATRITGRIQYNPTSDTLVGFVSPFEENGLPQKNAFVTSSAQEIESYFQNINKANYAYIIMAQTPIDKSPSFCVGVFGTDNRFTYTDCLRRLTTIKMEAEKYGIKVIGFSSDGDARLMKCMRIITDFPTTESIMPDENWDWFNMSLLPSTICIQDTVHIATKLRTRILKEHLPLILGNYEVKLSHLRTLIRKESKDKHFLTESDLKAEDKMNFKSAEKMCSEVVIQLLDKQGEDYIGTSAFLQVMQNIIKSFLSKTETICHRLYLICEKPQDVDEADDKRKNSKIDKKLPAARPGNSQTINSFRTADRRNDNENE
ncbi:unnamed protein product [Phaedon cochleariae]|uniref:Uncharacterized protein n=1 Tax=Phaedon cochleariae TaxID=80249 RepID=A0A9P0DWJ1_PHACE|nr:unnamed protein product [Phaedon cochleariae]